MPVRRRGSNVISRVSGGCLILLSNNPVTAAEEFDCMLEPRSMVNVSSPVEGLIAAVLVERGDHVKKDQVLARLESTVEKAAVDLARARSVTTATIDLRRARLDLYSRKDARGEDLYRKKFISLNEKDELETERTLGGFELREAIDNKHIAELELKRARAVLELRTIRSPVTGVVVERIHSPGEFIQFIKDDAIVKVAEIDLLNVEALLPVAMFGSVQAGMRAEVTPEAPAGGTYNAKVSIVDRVVDAASGTFGVRLELPNPEHKVPAGLKCRLRFLE